MDDKEDLQKRLVKLIGGDEAAATAKAKEIADKAVEEGATTVAQFARITEAEWKDFGLKKFAARDLVIELAAAVAPPPAPVTAPVPQILGASLLPQVPSEDSFLASLMTGGVLVPSPNDVLAGIRALNASRYGFFNDIENRLLAAMEDHARSNGAQVHPLYYEVQKNLTRKAHGDILAALGIASKVVNPKNTKDFLDGIQSIWQELSDFYDVIAPQVELWRSSLGQNGLYALIGMLAMKQGAGEASLPIITDTPNTASIVDYARGFYERVSKMFAVHGVPVARALAADAKQIQDILLKPELVTATGAATREQMLKEKLKITIGPDAERIENSVQQFALCVMELTKQNTSQLPGYIAAMCTHVGAIIPWSTLTGSNGARGGKSADPRLRAAAPYPSDPFGVKNHEPL